MIYPKKCIGCGECVSACPLQLHSFGSDNLHSVDRKRCIFCRKCAAECSGAIEISGMEMSVDEVIEKVLRDKSFYENSGGGLTVSGGEPLMHPTFVLELFKKAKEKNIHTAIETSGYANSDIIESILPFTDLVLFDVKETNSELHKQYTGKDNSLILENLKLLNQNGAKIILRCPIIPGYNDRDEHFEGIARLANELNSVERIDIEPYHNLGKGKAKALGKDYPLSGLTLPTEDQIKQWIEKVSSFTDKKVIKS